MGRSRPRLRGLGESLVGPTAEAACVIWSISTRVISLTSLAFLSFLSFQAREG
jgi:hypothetical protein